MVNVKESHALGLVVTTNKVVNGIRVSKAFLDLSIVVQVPFLENSLDQTLVQSLN